LPVQKNNYKYLNVNPELKHTKDCVCRAISTAVDGLSYNAVDKLLELTAIEYACEKLCACCYSYLLEDILGYPRTDCGFKQTVNQIAVSYPHNKLIIRIDAHLTSSINGLVMDIWDCSQELVDCFWIVP
jgi:hypothetical protein